MKQGWHAFLENRGAEFEEGVVIHFGNPERERRIVTAGEIIADLTHFGVIAVHGEDAQSFLQGQLTNDVRNVSEGMAQMSGLCSPKGRLLANFLIYKRGDSYYLRLPRSQVEPILKRLRMFVLMSKVTLEDVSDSLAHIGYAGAQAEKQLQELVPGLPVEPYGCVQSGELTVIRLMGVQPRFEIFGPLDAVISLWKSLDVRAAPVGAEVWELLDIRAGVPNITTETVDAFVPQMVNMQLIQGVSFKKGCYTGQEIVARMQYLGKLKRRMYLAHVNTDQVPVPGEDLFSGHSSSGQGTGKIVNAARAPEGGVDALAVIEISSLENDVIHLSDGKGPELTFRDLPYAFDPS